MNNIYKVKILIVGLTTVLSLTSFNSGNFRKGLVMIINKNSNN